MIKRGWFLATFSPFFTKIVDNIPCNGAPICLSSALSAFTFSTLSTLIEVSLISTLLPCPFTLKYTVTIPSSFAFPTDSKVISNLFPLSNSTIISSPTSIPKKKFLVGKFMRLSYFKCLLKASVNTLG